MTTTLNKGDAFQPGEVWQTPKGGLYKVMGYEQKPGKPKQAVLRVGADGAGRKVLRDWDAVIGWVIRSLDDAHVIERLLAGYELSNRGTGWWLSKPRQAYGAHESEKVDDAVVKNLERTGKIRIELLSRSLRAHLVQ